jgi:hypothetical protein
LACVTFGTNARFFIDTAAPPPVGAPVPDEELEAELDAELALEELEELELEPQPAITSTRPTTTNSERFIGGSLPMSSDGCLTRCA